MVLTTQAARCCHRCNEGLTSNITDVADVPAYLGDSVGPKPQGAAQGDRTDLKIIGFFEECRLDFSLEIIVALGVPGVGG